MNTFIAPHTVFVSVNEPPPPQDEWWYLLPDQFYGPLRECVPCPAVVRFGDRENPTCSNPVPLTREWQLFNGDLLSLSEYKRHYWELNNAEFDHIAQAYRGTYGNHTALTNWPEDEARADFFSRPPRDITSPLPTYDAVRGCQTNSYKGTETVSDHGEPMVQIYTFDWFAGPPVAYGLEILDDPRVVFATIITLTGTVKKFPRLVSDVPFAQISRYAVYIEKYKMQRYIGSRRAPYYTPSLVTQFVNLVRFYSRKFVKV